MEKKTEEMAAADRVCGGVAESLPFHSSPQRVAAVASDIECQLGALVKAHAKWSAT